MTLIEILKHTFFVSLYAFGIIVIWSLVFAMFTGGRDNDNF